MIASWVGIVSVFDPEKNCSTHKMIFPYNWKLALDFWSNDNNSIPASNSDNMGSWSLCIKKVWWRILCCGFRSSYLAEAHEKFCQALGSDTASGLWIFCQSLNGCGMDFATLSSMYDEMPKFLLLAPLV